MGAVKMGTYDTIGGTPRHDPVFDSEPPCDTCTRTCRTCGRAANRCECETGPDCDKVCPEITPKMRMPSGNPGVYWR